MPTVILLDKSLSMLRPASKEKPDTTRQSLACSGLEWFLDYLGECHPLEYTCLLSFSSTCDVVVPFTRNHASLKEKLSSVSVLDRTDLYAALAAMVEIIVGEWGSFTPCQAVLVTDGSPGVRHQDSAHRKQPLNIPFSFQLHVVCVATREELSQPSWSTKMSKLCDTTGVNPAEVYVPTAPLTLDSVKGAFVQLTKTSFRPYYGVLKCGHLQSQISLSPSPSIHKPKFDISITPDVKYPKLDESFGSLQYPNEMVICGFIDISALSACPHYARHLVLDPEVNEKELENKLLSPTVKRQRGMSISSEEKMVVDGNGTVSEESQKPSFRVLLHGSLKCESKAALVKLGEKWYALLFSQTNNSKKANLILSVFYPNAEIPWLGPLLYLGSKQPNVVDPRVQQSEEKFFPVPPSHLLSFQNPNNLLWAKETVLQTDVSKVIRYSRKLPDKEASLIKELNKLRLVALTYNMPELLEVLCIVLSKEESTSSNPQSKTLLHQCIFFLSNNKNPSEKLAITHK